MTSTRKLHDLGQSLWLDNLTRELLDEGTLRRYIEELSIAGPTSNPTIFDGAIGGGQAYDAGIREKARTGQSGERLFIELALEDLRRAADLVRPVFDASHHLDGWVSMEVSPLLAGDTDGSRPDHALAQSSVPRVTARHASRPYVPNRGWVGLSRRSAVGKNSRLCRVHASRWNGRVSSQEACEHIRFLATRHHPQDVA